MKGGNVLLKLGEQWCAVAEREESAMELAASSPVRLVSVGNLFQLIKDINLIEILVSHNNSNNNSSRCNAVGQESSPKDCVLGSMKEGLTGMSYKCLEGVYLVNRTSC